MSRNPNIAVVTIGYTHFALEDTQSALELMAILSKTVQIQVREYGLSDYTPCTHFLSDDSTMPEMKFVPMHKFNPHETVEEVKAKMEREKKDREDMEQQFREAPPALAAPELVDDSMTH